MSALKLAGSQYTAASHTCTGIEHSLRNRFLRSAVYRSEQWDVPQDKLETVAGKSCCRRTTCHSEHFTGRKALSLYICRYFSLRESVIRYATPGRFYRWDVRKPLKYQGFRAFPYMLLSSGKRLRRFISTPATIIQIGQCLQSSRTDEEDLTAVTYVSCVHTVGHSAGVIAGKPIA